MQVTIIGCPTELGLRRETAGVPSGTVHAPDALRAAGIVERLAARDAGNLPVSAYDPVRRDGLLNRDALDSFAALQAAAITAALGAGTFPLILGGDCSLLLGSLRAMPPRTGLIFLDGHTDFYTPETSGTGGMAGMDLWFACRSLIDPAHVVHMGRRDFEESVTYGGVLPPAILDLHLNVIRASGARAAARRALEHLALLDGAFIHVDADVLDVSCVDSPQAGGLTFDELREILEELAPSARGAEVTIYDPTKDRDGEVARALAGIFAGLPLTSR